MADKGEKIAGPNIEVGLDVNKLHADAEAGVRDLEKLAAASVKLKNNIDPTERGIVGFAAKLRALSPEAATEKLNRIAAAVDRVGAQSVKGAAQVEFLTKKVNDLAAAGGRVPPSLQGMVSQTDRLANAMALLNTRGVAGMSGLSGSALQAGMALGGITGPAALATAGVVGLGGAALGVAVSSAKVAMDFESAFARVRRVISPAEADLGALREGLVEMSTKIPVAATALADIAAMAGQMGITGTPNILKFTETVARLGVTADMAGEQAAMMLARIAQVNKIPIENVDHLASAVLGVGAQSNATTEEILRMTMQMQGLGSQAGLGATEMIALSATLAAGGVRVESAGTAMGRLAKDINEAVVNGGPKLQEWARLSKMSAEEFQAAWRADKMSVLFNAFKGLHDAGEGSTAILDRLGESNVRVLSTSGVLARSVDDLKRNYEEANAQMKNNTALMEQSGVVFGTTASGIQVLKQNFEAMGIALGSGPIQELGKLVELMTRLVKLTNDSGLINFYSGQIRSVLGTAAFVGEAAIAPMRMYEAYKVRSSGEASMRGKGPLLSHGDTNFGIGADMLKFTPTTPFQMTSSATGTIPPPTLSDEEQRALDHYTKRKIELEKEYQVALAKTKEGIEGAIDAIRAKARADLEAIQNDRQLKPAQQGELSGFVKKRAQAQELRAYEEEDKKQLAEKLKLVEASEAFTLKINRLTGEAHARESTGLDRIIKQIEAKVEALREEAELKTDPELRDQHEKEIERYEQVAKAAAIQHNLAEQQKRGAQMSAESEKEYLKLLDKTSPSLRTKLALLEVERKNEVDRLNRLLIEEKISEEKYKEEFRNIQKRNEMEAALLKRENEIQRLRDMATAFGALNQMLQAFGMSSDNIFGKFLTSTQGVIGGIGDFIASSGNPLGQITAGMGILGSVAPLFAENLFGQPEFKDVMDDVGHSWGAQISESTAQGIADSKFGHKIGALLSIDKILGENPDIDPSTFLPKMDELLQAIADGTVPARSGVEALGSAFSKLKSEAEGGNTSARNAMVQLIRHAKELNLVIPEMEAAIKQSIGGATAELKNLFGGQGMQQRGGNLFGGVSSEQASANIRIFDAVFEANVALDGLIIASEKTKEAFDALNAGLPAGTNLFGGAARASQINTLLETSPLFKGAAQTGAAGGKVLGGLFDAGALNQDTVSAFDTTLKNNMDQAVAGTAGLDLSPEERVRLAEEANLPLLTEMQHARLAGLKLSPETENILAQAEADGLLPALSVAEQSLQVQREIRDAIRSGGGANPHNTNSSNTGAGSGTYDNSAPISIGRPGTASGLPLFGDGGRIPYTPGGFPLAAGERGPEWIIPEDKLKAAVGGGMSLSMPTSVTVHAAPGMSEMEVGRAVLNLLERDLYPRLQTIIRQKAGNG